MAENDNQDRPHYQSLLNYFSANRPDVPEPIAHPDQTVNEMIDGREHTLRKASVLIPITRHESDSGSNIVLTVRSENLKSHAGQISLPGGTQEDHDVDDVATALRESEEEIGLRSHQVQVLGRLGEMALPSGFRVTPIVGIIETDIEFVPCPIEVADIFQAPLDLVLDPDSYTRSTMMFNNEPRQILELMYEDYRIWGATAAILYHLAREIRRS